MACAINRQTRDRAPRCAILVHAVPALRDAPLPGDINKQHAPPSKLDRHSPMSPVSSLPRTYEPSARTCSCWSRSLLALPVSSWKQHNTTTYTPHLVTLTSQKENQCRQRRSLLTFRSKTTMYVYTHTQMQPNTNTHTHLQHVQHNVRHTRVSYDSNSLCHLCAWIARLKTGIVPQAYLLDGGPTAGWHSTALLRASSNSYHMYVLTASPNMRSTRPKTHMLTHLQDIEHSLSYDSDSFCHLCTWDAVLKVVIVPQAHLLDCSQPAGPAAYVIQAPTALGPPLARCAVRTAPHPANAQS